MERIENLDYEDIKLESRNYAGLDGFDFIHEDVYGEQTVLVTVFQSDLKIAKAIDDALKQEFQSNDEDE